jgi:hypothetical protein
LKNAYADKGTLPCPTYLRKHIEACDAEAQKATLADLAAQIEACRRFLETAGIFAPPRREE